MTRPKPRNPAALRARQRQQQAGGPHDTETTRGEAEREAIAEQMDALDDDHARAQAAELERLRALDGD